MLWQLWSFLAPALQPHLQRTIGGVRRVRDLLFAGGLAFSYRVALPGGAEVPDDATTSNLQHPDPREGLRLVRACMVLVAVGVVFELPAFIVALVRLGISARRRCASNRRIGYVAVAALAVALPGVDPVTTVFEMVPLLVLFEASIWLSVLVERRGAAQPRSRGSAAL